MRVVVELTSHNIAFTTYNTVREDESASI